MIALGEPSIVAIISTALSGVTLVAIAVIGRGGVKRGKKLEEALKPENGHKSLGGGLAAIEDRIDGIQRDLKAHMDDVSGLILRAKRDWGEDGEKDDPL